MIAARRGQFNLIDVFRQRAPRGNDAAAMLGGRPADAGASLAGFAIDGLARVTRDHLDVMMPETGLIHAERHKQRGGGFAGGSRGLIGQGFEIPAIAAACQTLAPLPSPPPLEPAWARRRPA